MNFSTPRATDAHSGADNIDDGVGRADFVKVNPLQRNVVNLGLGGAQRQKNFAGQLLRALLKRRRGDDAQDVGEMAAVRMGVSVIMRMFVRVIMRVRMRQ